jgi:hypothetical protein
VNYERIKTPNLINKKVIKNLYKTKEEDVLGIYYFDPVNVIKITIMRKIPSGTLAIETLWLVSSQCLCLKWTWKFKATLLPIS